MRKLLLLPLLLLLALTGCGLFGERDDPTEGWDAERLYAEARGALDAGNYGRAIQYYQRLEARFPFGVHGQQALLDLAYAHYRNEDSDAAVTTANRFIQLHPRNPHVDYAYYLRGLANFNRGSGLLQRYLPVDHSQRDSSASVQAFQDFNELLQRFPDSRYADDARLRMIYLRNLLAQHEVHVANYYMRREAYVAAVNRARFVLENYPRTPSTPEALTIMAKAYKVLEMDDLSEDALRVLELNFPNHPGVNEVRRVVVR
jgi:outer membrane protein assembly factor BamD